MNNIEFRELLKYRTKSLALRVIRLYQALPRTTESQIIGKQLLRSATSVAANYRAACRARSNPEFYAKISIVIEEADECLFWMEILYESGIIKKELIIDLYAETEEILKIMVTSRKNSQKPERKQ
ncbi:MAG: four helix bundle protein [Bacteroidales bacterium]|nr:four helix bundle protein [Bacteroidales bacterium]